MFRRLAIITMFCCVAGYANQVWSEEPVEPGEAPPRTELPTMSCQQLVDGDLPPASRFSLTGFQPGKHFVPTDADQDGHWEQVVVPLFPADKKRLGHNYRSVLIYFGDIPDFDTLMARLKQPRLTVQYRPHQQEVDRYTYNQLAQHYRSMDFRKCVVAYSGFPETSVLASPWLVGGGMLLLGGLIIGAWQTFIGTRIQDENPRHSDGTFEGVELVTDDSPPQD